MAAAVRATRQEEAATHQEAEVTHQEAEVTHQEAEVTHQEVAAMEAEQEARATQRRSRWVTVAAAVEGRGMVPRVTRCPRLVTRCRLEGTEAAQRQKGTAAVAAAAATPVTVSRVAANTELSQPGERRLG